MNLATGWIALALLGADEPTTSAGPLIRYEMRVLEMKGLDWRGKAHEKLAIVARQGTATIWTASKSAVPELVKAAEKVMANPRVSSAPETDAVFEHEDLVSIVDDMKRVADGPVDHASAVAYRPEVEKVRDYVRCSVNGASMDQGTLAHVEVDHAKLMAIHTFCVSETLPNAKTGPTTLKANVQVPEMAHGRVEGDWMIPADGVLVVGLGLYSPNLGPQRAEPCERVVLIEACPIAPDPSARPAPPMAIGRSRLPAPPIDFGPKPAPLTPPPAFALATPLPPSRALPTAIARDGSVVELPPLPEEVASHAEPSAEPRAAAQARPAPSSPGVPKAEPSPNRAFADAITSAGHTAIAAAASSPTAVPCPAATSEEREERKGTETPFKISLDQAIRIGIGNSSVVKTISVFSPRDGHDTLTIGPASTDRPSPRLNEEIAAHVRSVEQTYWALSMALSQKSAASRAVEVAEKVLAGEKASPNADSARVAEAEEVMARLKLDLVEKAELVKTCERQLRNILGLAAADGRRLVPVTPPVDPKDSPVPASEVASKIDRLSARINEGGPSAADRQELRFYLILDSTAKLLAASEHLSKAAQLRMDAQKAFYSTKRITVDRCVDAVRNLSNAQCQEADYRCQYSTALAALAEADGSLLARHHIRVALPASSFAAMADPRFAPAQYELDGTSGRRVRSSQHMIDFGHDFSIKIRVIPPQADDASEDAMCVPSSN